MEALDALEAGGKTRWLDGRLTLERSSVLLRFYEPAGRYRPYTRVGGFVLGIDNAAKAELYGIDADTSFRVSDHWSVVGGVVWLGKREFVEYENDETGDTLSGNELVRSPEWSANAAIEYEQSPADLGGLTARIEYSYRSDFYWTPRKQPPLFRRTASGHWNTLVRFDAASGRWYAFASGRNLTDEDYFNQVFIQASPGYPDTYEVGVGYHFLVPDIGAGLRLDGIGHSEKCDEAESRGLDRCGHAAGRCLWRQW